MVTVVPQPHGTCVMAMELLPLWVLLPMAPQMAIRELRMVVQPPAMGREPLFLKKPRLKSPALR